LLDLFTEQYPQLLNDIRILDVESLVTEDYKKVVRNNPDVSVWLDKVCYSTRPGYVTSLCHFLKCVNLEDPGRLLDLKGHDDPRQRFFPAERLAEVWMSKARQQGLSNAMIKRTMDAVRSFFKSNRIPLIEVKCSYKPRPKGDLTDEDLRAFREGFNWYGKILFDFMLSVPVRDGQFQRCENCGQDFFPRWENVKTFPIIEAYSPFTIRTQKGHESDEYPDGLTQVCFLTETAARALNNYKDLKERFLDRKLKPSEYIFTHQKGHMGPRHVAPIGTSTIISFFQQASARTGKKIMPHRFRAWVNTILAARGIDKQVRDVYLGHTCSYEQGYIMQMIPKWQQTFREAKAMEHLDIMGAIVPPQDLEAKLLQIESLQKEIDRLKTQVNATKMSDEDFETMIDLLQMIREGRIKIGYLKRKAAATKTPRAGWKVPVQQPPSNDS
jgi:hypothetical protein